MRFTPKTEEEIQAMGLIEEGIYDFKVVDASDEISKAGNEMIKLIIMVWDNNGSEKTVFDYLLESIIYKIRHFAEVGNLLDKYESGTLLAENCLEVAGKIKIGIQKGKTDGKGGFYPDKNVVKDYVTTSDVKTNASKSADEPFIDDELPF